MATREDVVIRFGGDAKGVDATMGKIRKGVSGLGAQLGALGLGLSFAAVTREMVTQMIALENLGKAFAQVTGSAAGSAEAMAYVREVSERLGLEVVSTAQAYLSLSAAAKGTNLEGAQSKRIFEAVAGAMAKLGKSADDTKGALLAIEQMISKGKVSAEELRGQLGERLPGAFGLAARAMGVTTTELDKMLSTGKIVAGDMLPKLATELEKAYATGERVEGTVAAWNRLKNTFGEVSEKAGVFLLPAMTSLLNLLSSSVDAGEALSQTLSHLMSGEILTDAERKRLYGKKPAGETAPSVPTEKEKSLSEVGPTEKFKEELAKRRMAAKSSTELELEIWRQYSAEKSALAFGDEEAARKAQEAQEAALTQLAKAGASKAMMRTYEDLVGRMESKPIEIKAKTTVEMVNADTIPGQLQAGIGNQILQITLDVTPRMTAADYDGLMLWTSGGDPTEADLPREADKTGANP